MHAASVFSGPSPLVSLSLSAAVDSESATVASPVGLVLLCVVVCVDCVSLVTSVVCGIVVPVSLPVVSPLSADALAFVVPSSSEDAVVPQAEAMIAMTKLHAERRAMGRACSRAAATAQARRRRY